LRATDQRAKQQATTQSVWKLNQGVSVGGQTILGLHYLAELRFHSEPEISRQTRVWPFETGWGLPEAAGIVLAEIFPSLLEVESRLGRVPDESQVLSCTRHAAREDGKGRLSGCFEQPAGAPPADLQAAADEEGWILFS
jgi:hypothetical protein